MTYESNRWCCIQDMGNGGYWFYDYSLSYTRTESIKKCIEDTTTTWRKMKQSFGWRCTKVCLTITEIKP